MDRDDKDTGGLEYDVQKRAKAGTSATFRGVVALYIIYLGYKVIQGAGDETSTMPPWLCWVGGIALIAAGLGCGYYAWRRWHIDVEAARIKNENTEEDTPES